MSGVLDPDSGVTYEEFEGTLDTISVAGSETTATLLSGLTYLLLTNPDKMATVCSEVRDKFSSAEQIDSIGIIRVSMGVGHGH